MQDGSATASTWKSSNVSCTRTCRWNCTTRRQTSSWHMQSRNKICQGAAPGSCASQALPNLTHSSALQNHSCNASPTLLCNLLVSAQLLYAFVTEVHLPHGSFPPAFSNTKGSICFLEHWNAKKAKLFLCYPSQVTELIGLLPAAGGRREKIKEMEKGKDAAGRGRTDCWDMEKKGTLLDRKKTTRAFWVCINLVVLGQIQRRLASFH